MYTVSKGPSKIVAKTRRGIKFGFLDVHLSPIFIERFVLYRKSLLLAGINQNLERLETLRDLTRKADPDGDHEITR